MCEFFVDEEETEIYETDCVQSIVKEKGNLSYLKSNFWSVYHFRYILMYVDISQERTTDHAVTSHLKINETENFLRVKKNLFNKEESILERVNVPNNNGKTSSFLHVINNKFN